MAINMNGFLYGAVLQWKLDLRNKGVLLTYYVVPLLFFAFMGGIFTSINQEAKATLIQSMTIFGVSMGAILGAPVPLSELYGSEIKKAYKVGGIPVWVSAANNFLSAFLHLLLMSLVIYLAAPLAFQAEVPKDTGAYFASLALLIAVCLSVGTALGLYFRGSSRLTMLSQLVFLPSLMLSGIMFPTELLPKALAQAGKAFPATWGFRMMTTGGGTSTALLAMGGFFALMAVLIAFRLQRLRCEK